MKKLFIIMFLSIAFMLRFSTAIRITEIFQKEVYKIELNVEDGKAKILKINGKYPLKKYYARINLKENGHYLGYYQIQSIKYYNDLSFLNLEEIKSQKIEGNFFEKYLSNVFERLEKNYYYSIKNMNRAILLGDNTQIKRDLQEKIRYIGLSHMFAMSGLHIGLVVSIFYFFFKKFFNNKKIIEIVLLITTTIYYFSVKESPSFTRAYIMVIIYIFGKILYEKVDMEKTLFISAYISAMINPTVIFSISFQLSYLAMISIIYIYPIARKINLKRFKVLDYLIFTLSIQLFLAPITVYYFETIPFLSIFSNLLILPLATFYISLNYIALFLENFYLGFILSPFIKVLYYILEYLIKVFSDVPYMSLTYSNPKLLYVYILISIVIIAKKYQKVNK